MACSDQILAALETLAAAYRERKLEAPTVQTYVDHLTDLPAWLLDQSIAHLIQTSPFYPKISEIRKAAAHIARTNRFDELPQEQTDRLAQAAQELEDAFYQAGSLNPAQWQALAEAFTLADRPHRAEHTLEKLRRLQSIQIRCHSVAVQ